MKTKERFWYSRLYQLNNYGFYVTKYNNKYFMGYKHKKGKTVEVKIRKDSFDVLKREWK